MSNWKASGTHVKATSALLALTMTLAAVHPQWVQAQQALNRVTDVRVSPTGELIINVDGEGFDPILRLEPAPHGEFRIVVQGYGVTLAPGLAQTTAHLSGDLSAKIPAIEGAQVSGNKGAGKLSGAGGKGPGFQLVLTSWQKLQPQVLSNDGQQVIISLVGNRRLPAAVAQRRQLAEQQRVVLQKQQADLKKQAELKAQERLQHQAALKQQAEATRQAAMQRQATEQQLAAVQKQKGLALNRNIQRLAQPKLQAETPELPDEAQYQAELQQEKKALEAQRRQALAHKGAQQDSSGWQTAYVGSSSTGAMTQLQLAQRGAESSGVKNLMQEVSPKPVKPLSPTPASRPAQPTPAQPFFVAPSQVEPAPTNTPAGESSDENMPSEPLRLTKPPSNYVPEPEWQAQPQNNRPVKHVPGKREAQPSPSQSQPAGADSSRLNSIYAVLNTANADASLRHAWNDLMAGNAGAAQATLRQRLQSAPNDVNARYLLAQILLSPLLENPNASPTEAAQALTARREEARQELLKNYAQSLHWPSCQTLLELFLDEGKLEEASRILAQASKAYPHEAGVAFEQGRLQEALGDLEAARAAYQQAMGLQPDNPEIHYRLAQVELKSNHLEAARWELLQALTWSPNDSRLYKLLGYIADKTGHAPQAAQAYRQALPVDALINYARALEAQNQPDRALSLYQAVEALAGDNGDILYNLAMIYTNTRRPARATAVLTRFLALGGNQHDARLSKAQALLKQLSNKK
jgi:Flp pilus assembly protein TadD